MIFETLKTVSKKGCKKNIFYFMQVNSCDTKKLKIFFKIFFISQELACIKQINEKQKIILTCLNSTMQFFFIIL